MPVRRDTRGRWIFRHVVELPPDKTGKRRKKRIYGTAPRHRNTKAAAQQAMLDAIERWMHPERFPAPKAEDAENNKEVPTLREFVEGRFMDYCAGRNKFSGLYTKKSILRAHLLPAFGDKRLDEIRTLQIEDYKTEKLTRGRLHKGPAKTSGRPRPDGLAKKTINNHLTVLGRILNVAKEWEIIDCTPKIELYKTVEPRIDFLDFGEAERLIAAAATLPVQFDGIQVVVGEGDWGRMIVLALKTGMRIGEILALRKENAGLVTGSMHVCEATYWGVVDTPKSGKPRDIPLSRQARATLQAQRHLRGPLVFCDLDGKPLRYHECLIPLARACEIAGLRRVTWHALRHTFASHLVMRGVSLKAVQELLGHASILETMRYSHLAPAVRTAAVEMLDDPAPSFESTSDEMPAAKSSGKSHGTPED